MKIRLLIYLILAIIAMGLFLFVPNLNIGSKQAISLYQEAVQGAPLLSIIGRILFFGAVIFFGLLFLFGSKKESKKEQEQDHQPENEK